MIYTGVVFVADALRSGAETLDVATEHRLGLLAVEMADRNHAVGVASRCHTGKWSRSDKSRVKDELTANYLTN